MEARLREIKNGIMKISVACAVDCGGASFSDSLEVSEVESERLDLQMRAERPLTLCETTFFLFIPHLSPYLHSSHIYIHLLGV